MAQRIEMDQLARDDRSPEPVAERDDGRSIGSLIKELGDESSRLVQDEVRLAKTEMREKVDVYERNAAKMGVGGVLLLGAVFVLLVAVNRGLTVMLDQFMSLETAVWLSPLILAALAALIGWSMFTSARRAIALEGVAPRKTVETLRSEKDWVRQEAREARHG